MLAHSLDNLRVLVRMFIRLMPGEAGHSYFNTAFGVHGEVGIVVVGVLQWVVGCILSKLQALYGASGAEPRDVSDHPHAVWIWQTP